MGVAWFGHQHISWAAVDAWRSFAGVLRVEVAAAHLDGYSVLMDRPVFGILTVDASCASAICRRSRVRRYEAHESAGAASAVPRREISNFQGINIALVRTPWRKAM
jgi:hypothetical protein